MLRNKNLPEMIINIGINGFGRIGRIVFRRISQIDGLQVSAINDPAIDVDYICYLIKFDSTHGRFKKDITFSGNDITVNGIKMKVFHEKSPANIPWEMAEVHYVVEASGMFTNFDKASGHLVSKSVKRVILTAPSVDIPMMILGVNEDKIGTEHKVISCASSTLYCLAPLIKILDDNYGVVEGFITSIHAMTPSLKPLDGLCLRGKHWRDYRSIHQNIIPAATGACKALSKIIPRVKDKMTGLAFRVPIVNVSVLDVTVRLNKNTMLEDIIRHVDHSSKHGMKNIIKTSSEEAVSSDFMGDDNSCIVDINSSLQLTPNFFKLICWYENEYSYACRVADSIMYSEKCFSLDLMFKLQSPYKFTSTFHRRPIWIQKVYLKSPNIQPKAKLSASEDNDFGIEIPIGEIEIDRKYRKLAYGTSESDNPIHKIEIANDYFKPKVRGNVNSFFHSYLTKPDNKIESNIENLKKGDTNTEDVTKTITKPTICNNRPMSGNMYSRSNKYKNVFQSKSMIIKDNNEANVTLHQIKDANIHTNKNTTNYDSKVNTADDISISKTLEEIKCNTLESSKLEYNDSKSYSKNVTENIIQLHNINVYTTDHVITDSGTNVNKKFFENKIDDYCDKNYFKNKNELENIDNKLSTNNVLNNDKSEIAKYIDTINQTAKKYFQCDKVIVKSNTEVDEQIVENVFAQDSTVYNVDELSISPVTTTTASNGDIYDKLDSASASGSDNSFQIHERKSQVINITDLTASVDDFERLEKICRIIEISDDLSDRLFSALNDESGDLKVKTWSFKDLCERLKLDEFYNRVFGHKEIRDV